jgi:hypothetical protein
MKLRKNLTILALFVLSASCRKADPVIRRLQEEGAGGARTTDEASRQALDRKAERQTVADLRNVGTAMFCWLTDHVGAGAAGQSQTDKPNKTADFKKYAPISRAELEKVLVPQYLQSVPETDGWGNPYEFYLNVAHPLAKEVMAIRSPGRDGRFSATDYVVGPFAPDNFDEDIVWIDGYFVRWPQKQEG